MLKVWLTPDLRWHLVAAGRIKPLSKPYPREFREDVIAVARQREVPLSKIAKDFGISKSCLRTWLQQAGSEDGSRPGISEMEAAENRALKKRLWLVEQENEVLRRAAAYLSQVNLRGK